MARLRRAARAAADNAACLAASLPPVLLARVWALLPLHTRFACACVCRAWRDAAASSDAWLSLHLRGVPHSLATNALLIAAATRAAGEMHTLDLEDCPWLLRSLFDEASLAPFVALHGASLRDLCAPRCLAAEDVALLLRNAPRLCTLRADVDCTYAEARAMLRGEEPYNGGSLRLRRLCVDMGGAAPADLLAGLEACPFPPAGLNVFNTPLDAPGALDSLLDTARTLRLRTLGLEHSRLPAAEEACEALGRLLCSRECAVTRLELSSLRGLLHTPEDATRLGDALLCARTLTALELRNMKLWRRREVGAVLLDRMAPHPTLRTLLIADEVTAQAAPYVGDALGVLIADAACGLRTLDVCGCALNRGGLRPLLEALPRAQRLRALVLDPPHDGGLEDGDLADDEAFREHVLLPAVVANASLWRLRVPPPTRGHRGAVRKATQLVKERRLAAGIECLADAGVEFGPFSDDDEMSANGTDSDSAAALTDDSDGDLEPEELPPVITTARGHFVAFDF